MRLDLKFISILLILLAISISSVSAGTDIQSADADGEIIANDIQSQTNITNEFSNDILYDNYSNGLNNNLMEDNSAPFSQLQSQIYNAQSGDIIGLQTDYVYDENFKVNGISIDRTLTIEGNGVTLDGRNTGRIFYITGSDVVIKNINFVNGAKDAGGAIFFKSNKITVENCTFSSNSANSTVGGAVYIISDDSVVKDSFFDNNFALSSGGALRIEGKNNLIENNVFYNNVANNSLGGAVCALGHNITIRNNTFNSNVAGRDGGAIDIEGITVASFGKENLIYNNSFSANSAIYGGAISINGENDTIENNFFSRNHASELGGAIRWVGSPINTGVINNNAFLNNFAQISGGAMYIVGNTTQIFSNSFYRNSAESVSGGSITIHGINNFISKNSFNESKTNMSGGSIYSDGEKFVLQDNSFMNSSSGTSGGAVYIVGNYGVVKDNQFISNNASTLAGAIQIKSNSSLIENNTFNGNSAINSGGSAYIEGDNIKILKNIFTLNNAGSASVGGAIRFIGNYSIINDNYFECNVAGSGYAIFGNGNNASLNNNSFVGQIANDSTFKWEGTNNLIKIKTVLTLKQFSYVSTATKTLTATLKDNLGNPLSGKKLSFTVNGKKYTANTNSKGIASVKLSLNKKGTYTYKVSFVGDNYLDAVTKSSKLTVTLASTVFTIKKYTFKRAAKTKKVYFTLKSGKTLLKSKKVTLRVNGKTYTAKTNSKGVAVVNVKLTKKGTYTYAVKFAGDTTYKAITKKQKIVIK